jgi:hypothetical protein
MDLEENIRIAAKQFIKDCNVFGLVNALEGGVIDLDKLLIDFCKSQAAKDYWYNKFKRELFHKKRSIGFSTLLSDFAIDQAGQMIFGTGGGPTDEENELWQKQVIEPTYRYDEFVQYRKDNPEKEISYKEWSDMMDNYNKITKEVLDEAVKPFFWIDKAEWDAEHNTPGGHPVTIIIEEDWFSPEGILSDKPQVDKDKRPIGFIGAVDRGSSLFADRADKVIILPDRNKGKSLMASIEQIPFEISGLNTEHCKGVIVVVPDALAMECKQDIERMISVDKSIQRIIVVTKEHYKTQGKYSLLKMVENSLPKSIVLIDDIMPEKELVISRHESIAIEAERINKHAMDKPWNIKKQKKVSHKRTNKRK